MSFTLGMWVNILPPGIWVHVLAPYSMVT